MSFNDLNRCFYNTGLAKIENCYSIGTVSGDFDAGGFCADQFGFGTEEINFCYWDTETSMMDSSDGGTGKTTAEMKMQATFETWNFNTIWCIGEHETYPQLQFFTDCDTLTSVKVNQLGDNINISIYPNPADDFIIVSINNELEIIFSIQIVDITGRIIIEQLVDNGDNEIKFSTSEIASGFYIVRIKTNIQSMSYTIIIK